MRVELLAVGTELLLGATVNSSAAWLGERLAEAGVDVTRSVAVGDDVDTIADAVGDALDAADAVIVTGGLGPTRDDLTHDALAAVAGVHLRRDPEVERALRERYASVGAPMRANTLRQADVPEGATTLPNERGTAPGLRMGLPGGVVYALPGVPREMRAMFLSAVRPDLLVRAGKPAAIVSRTLRTAVIWESAVGERLAGLDAELAASGRVTLAYLAAPAQVRVRVTAKAETRQAAFALVAPVEERVRRLLGDAVYGVDDETLDEVVHRLLAEQEATVAVAESLTGGLLGAELTEMSGSSATFRGGMIAYATDLKAGVLGVPEDLLATHGAVHPDVALAMATGARDRLDATYGLGLTGVAGPNEQDGRPVGTVHIGLAGPGGERTVTSPRLVGDRHHIRELAVVHTLDLLRRRLLGVDIYREVSG